MHLGELNAISSIVPDVNVFIRMHTVKKATQSSRIAGTRTRIDEARLEAKDISPESRNASISVAGSGIECKVCRQEYSGVKRFPHKALQSPNEPVHLM